jgi:hypothetical protein
VCVCARESNCGHLSRAAPLSKRKISTRIRGNHTHGAVTQKYCNECAREAKSRRRRTLTIIASVVCVEGPRAEKYLTSIIYLNATTTDSCWRAVEMHFAWRQSRQKVQHATHQMERFASDFSVYRMPKNGDFFFCWGINLACAEN